MREVGLKTCPSAARDTPEVLAALILATVMMHGCASPGPPRPPSLRLPAVVKNLSATRTGDDVVLRWTTPSETTDGLDLKGMTTAKICRETIVASAGPASGAGWRGGGCDPVQEEAVRPGDSSATVSLLPTFRVEPVRLLAYRLEIVNSVGRSAGMSAPAYTAAGSAPPGLVDLRVTPSSDGAVIAWRREPGVGLVELHRVNGKPRSPGKTATVPLEFGSAEPAEVRLRAEEVGARGGMGGDLAGTIDHGARSGETYRYVVCRIRQVEAGGHALEIRGASSPEVGVVMKDVFPPRSPTGLVSVANAPLGGAPSIDLSWVPNTEVDLAGYVVYRRVIGLAAGGRQRLTAARVATPAFEDRTVAEGQRYAYSVSAIDKAGNESAASGEVEERVDLP